jgi:hypothetical protein
MDIRELSGQDFAQWVNLRRALWPYNTTGELSKEAEEFFLRFALNYMVFVLSMMRIRLGLAKYQSGRLFWGA